MRLLDVAPSPIVGIPTFDDCGGPITDETICAALDLVVWCEGEGVEGEGEDVFDERCRAVDDSLKKVDAMLRRYAQSMQPCSLGEMQKAYYRLTNSLRYRQSGVSISAVRAVLDKNWNGIGAWRS